ncbi:4-carboxymuconolactone decarboxylase [Bosea sp. (in: a-proteobacteria)]|uniref:4-carboxymuconolactone decarboxylase n=1 Tax=Bosea sp. (in: a-proteobacteria) TaxID=1871050 RepID=UPI002FC68F1A
MDDKTRYENGLKTRRAVLGDAHVDKATAGITEFSRDFQEFITRTAWNDIWNRPGLTRRERSLIVLSITVALGAWGEFRLHVRAALNNGLTQGDIKELLIQAGVYAGVPAANHAFKEAASVFAEIEAEAAKG